MEYIGQGLRLPKLAKLFAFLGTVEALAGSNLAQSNSISTVLSSAMGADKLVVGLVLAVLVSVSLAGGIKRLGRITELLVPLMAVIFIGGGVAVIAFHWRAVPAAFGQNWVQPVLFPSYPLW